MPSSPREHNTIQAPLLMTSSEDNNTPRAEAHDEAQAQPTAHVNTQSLPAVDDNLPPPWQTIFKKEFEQSWPLMLRGAVVAGRYFAISVMLGKVDERLLAPNTLINALETVYITFGGGSLGIMSSIISKANGENKKTEIGVLCRQGLVFATLLSIPISLLYYFVNNHLLTLFGQHPFAVEKAKDYFQSAASGYLPLMLLTAQQRLLQGLQRPIPVLMSNVLHSSLSVACSYLFLFGKLNAPTLEMKGVGYAFSIAGWGSLLINTLYLKFHDQIHQFFNKLYIYLCTAEANEANEATVIAPYKIFHTQFDLSSNDFNVIIKKGLPAGLQ